jgi:ubiquinol-cytochrome c reductase iron-sulfur subunit
MTAAHAQEPTRRDFLMLATGVMGVVGGAAAIWPFIAQMNPDASVLAVASSEVNLSAIPLGQSITVLWRGKPVFIRHRTEQEIQTARQMDVNSLPDPYARNPALPENAPATDENRAQRPEWLISIGICTHLGCVPLAYQGDYDSGYFCPCHGSHYDTAGRIRKGPAPENLHLPPYQFVSDAVVRIG